MVQTEVAVDWGYGPEQNEEKPLEKQTVMSVCHTQNCQKPLMLLTVLPCAGQPL